MTGTHIVVGGGLNGLMLADRLADRGTPVMVLESEDRCGGLLRSFDYGQFGQFDYGTHILSETGDAELDAYLTGILPPGEWNFLRGSQRDLAGLYFQGRLQTHSSYPDLASLAPELYGACVVDFLSHLSEDDGTDAANAEDYLIRRFGPLVAAQVAGPILERFARLPAAELTHLALRLIPLNRMAMFPSQVCRDVVDTRILGPRIAYVDQHDIPPHQLSKLAAFYPRQRGLQRVIDALTNRLLDKGVKILCGRKLGRLARGNDANGISVELGDGTSLDAQHVYWMANPFALATALGVGVRWGEMDKPLTTVLCHYVVKTQPSLADLYYVYCADPGFSTYRITNYNAYCQPAEGEAGFPLTTELLLTDKEFEEAGGGLETLGLSELERMGVVAQQASPMFARAEVLKYGFPRPSLRNAREIARVRDEILNVAGRHVSMLGIGSREGLFFMSDVLRETFKFSQSSP